MMGQQNLSQQEMQELVRELHGAIKDARATMREMDQRHKVLKALEANVSGALALLFTQHVAPMIDRKVAGIFESHVDTIEKHLDMLKEAMTRRVQGIEDAMLGGGSVENFFAMEDIVKMKALVMLIEKDEDASYRMGRIAKELIARGVPEPLVASRPPAGERGPVHTGRSRKK